MTTLRRLIARIVAAWIGPEPEPRPEPAWTLGRVVDLFTSLDVPDGYLISATGMGASATTEPRIEAVLFRLDCHDLDFFTGSWIARPCLLDSEPWGVIACDFLARGLATLAPSRVPAFSTN